MISNWWTDAAPWRCTVPRQSAPVSPPPMITTRLPAALIGVADTGSSASTARLASGRNSMAWWMPASVPARDGQLPGHGRPDRQDDGVVGGPISGGGDRRPRPPPTATPHTNSVPSASHLIQAPVEDPLLHLELGDPVAQQAAGLVVALVDGHGVAGPGELLGGGQPGRPRADDRHPPAGLRLRAARASPIPRPRPGR